MVNKYRPHVLILPEDEANSQIATGFQLQLGLGFQRQMQVLAPSGGWVRVLEHFRSEHASELQICDYRFMVLLIDCDGIEDRLEGARTSIPGHLRDRVFVLGVLTDPEALRREIGSYETIGGQMADDCRAGTDKIWGHKLLRHNATEIDRLRRYVRPILFP